MFRNFNRIHNEYIKYNCNPFLNPYYKAIEDGYRVDIELKKIHEDYNKYKLVNNCKKKEGVKVKKFNNYNFYFSQK